MARSALGPDPLLWEILAHDGNSEVTLYFGTHTVPTSPTDTPPNTVYIGALTDPGSIDHRMFENLATSGDASVDVGMIELANTGEFDAFYNYGWGRRAVLKMIPGPGAPVANAEVMLVTTVVGIESADAPRTLRFRTRSKLIELDRPLLTERYLGTTNSFDAADPAEGDTQLLDQIKPYIFGYVRNVPAKVVNPFGLVYQFCVNACEAITPYDGGLPITIAGDVSSIAALLAVPGIPPGQCVTCLNEGAVRFASTPAFEVTADVQETFRSASQTVSAILDLAGVDPSDIDQDSFDDFHTFNDALVGIYISDDSSVLANINLVADSVGGGLTDTSDGLFQCVFAGEPSADVDAVLTLRELLSDVSMQLFAGPSEEGGGVPAWKVIVRYAKNYKIQSAGDLAGLVVETDLGKKERLSKEWSEFTRSDEDIKVQHPRAVELTFDTLLYNLIDAATEAERRLSLYKVRRDRISFSLSFAEDNDAGKIELGRSVTVTMPRFGYDAGKNFVVIGRKDDFKNKIRTLKLWG